MFRLASILENCVFSSFNLFYFSLRKNQLLKILLCSLKQYKMLCGCYLEVLCPDQYFFLSQTPTLKGIFILTRIALFTNCGFVSQSVTCNEQWKLWIQDQDRSTFLCQIENFFLLSTIGPKFLCKCIWICCYSYIFIPYGIFRFFVQSMVLPCKTDWTRQNYRYQLLHRKG